MKTLLSKHIRRGFLMSALTVGLMLVGASTALAGDGDGLAPDAWSVIHSELEFCWDGLDCGTTGMHFNRDGTFYSDTGGEGDWLYRRGLLDFQYTTGCLPLYSGQRVGRRAFEGTMQCQDGSGSSGTWTMFIVGRNMTLITGPNPPSVGTSSGPVSD